MKKILLLILLITISSPFCFSQIAVGVKAGATASNMQYDELNYDHSVRVGYYLGAFSEIRIGEKMFIRPELLYSIKGARFDETQEGTINLGYVNVPVLLGFKPIPKLSVHAGPELGFLVIANSKVDNQKYDLKQLNVFEEFDLGASIGLAYTLSPGLALDVRYVHGFANLMDVMHIDESGTQSRTIKDGNNRTFQVGVSYKFFER